MDCTEFFAGCCRDLEITADSDSAQQATLLAFALAFLEAGVVGGIERLLEHTEEIAAVVCHVRCGFEGQVALADHVASAQVKPVDAELSCREIERALDIIIAFGPP